MQRLRQSIDLLARQPFSAPETAMAEVRVMFVGRYPYKVLYRVREDAIEIVHIRHTARRPSEFEDDE